MKIQWNLLGLLLNPRRLSQPNRTNKRWLDVQGDAYLFTLHLQGVDDPLADDAIWDKQYGGQSGIRTGIGGKAQSTCLHDALRDHPCIMTKIDANNSDRLEDDPRTFSDVLVRIPAKHWNNEAKQGGYQIQRMVSRLTFNHKRDFKNLLNPERGVHYCVMPDDYLQEGEVSCQFGLSVYIPAADEKPHSDLSLRKAGKGYPFPHWIFFEEGKKRKRAFGLYKNQAYLQLGHGRKNTCITPPIWFNQHQGFIQLILDGDENDRQQYADGKYIVASSEPEYGYGGRIVCRYHAVETPEDQLALEIISHSLIADRIREEGGDAGAVLRGLTIAPSRRRRTTGDSFRLLLVGFALPRLDIAGTIASWRLNFNCQGGLVEPKEMPPQHGLQFSAQAQQASVWWQCPDMAAPEPLQPPLELDCSGIPFKLHPAPVSTEHYALLALPSVLPLPLDGQPCTLGRPNGNIPNTQGRHIALDLLDKAGTLQNEQGEALEKSMNYLGFSSQHIGLQIHNGELQVRQMSTRSPTYVLDTSGKLRETLEAGDDREITLQVGEQLLVGAYWLYFDRQAYG